MACSMNPQCESGLVCEGPMAVATGIPYSPSGRCIPNGIVTSKSSPSPTVLGEGGSCGGYIPNPPVCSPSLYCSYPTPTNTLIAYEGPGTCVKPTPTSTACVKLYAQCGGRYYNGIKSCCSGSNCVYKNECKYFPSYPNSLTINTFYRVERSNGRAQPSSDTGRMINFRLVLTFLCLLLARRVASQAALNSTCNPQQNNTAGCTDTVNAVVCTGGNSPGAFLLYSPVQFTVAEVKNTLNISWDYTTATNVNRYPNKTIDIYYQSTLNYNPQKWDKTVVAGLNPKAKSYLWTVPQVQNGDFVIRLVADGIDPLVQIASGKEVCVPDGAPLPYLSSKFKVVNPVHLYPVDDPLPPNTSASEMLRPLFLGTFVLMMLAVVWM
ncbi:hypothetical protein HK098_002195 [Nowakowskiella sp. JEL0407]|nr:hypothetical protein HK098_002195 [Nowakowskiella sp. JEL0407]